MPQNETDIRSSLVRLAGEAIDRSDLFVVDVQVRGRQGSRVIEVYVDGDEGVDVDVLAKVSRKLAYLMDVEDPIRGKYRLNVSSPGVERSLRIPRQFQRHTGRTIEMTVQDPEGSGEHLVEIGELLDAGVENVVLLKKTGEKKQVTYGEIEAAHIVMPW